MRTSDVVIGAHARRRGVRVRERAAAGRHRSVVGVESARRVGVVRLPVTPLGDPPIAMSPEVSVGAIATAAVALARLHRRSLSIETHQDAVTSVRALGAVPRAEATLHRAVRIAPSRVDVTVPAIDTGERVRAAVVDARLAVAGRSRHLARNGDHRGFRGNCTLTPLFADCWLGRS